MNKDVVVNRGIGKIIYDKIDPEWNFPHFHFIVFSDNSSDDDIYAFCMELGVEGFGSNDKEAIKTLIHACNKQLGRLLEADTKDRLFQHLNVLAEGTHSDHFWEMYRKTEISLASESGDLGNKLLQQIRQEMNEHIRKERDIYIKDLVSWFNTDSKSAA
ncbi:MAG: hypothetical protein ACR2PY_00660 [Salinispira sp.]